MVDAIDPGRIGGPIVIPTLVMVRFHWQLANARAAYNVLHGIVAPGFVPTPAIATALYNAIFTGGLWTALQPFLLGATNAAGIDLIDLRTANNAVVSSTVGAAVGTGAGTPLAPQTCLVVTKRTAFAGPAYRGRVYVPGWASNAMGGNTQALPACVTALQAWATGWLAAFAGQGLTLALAHPARSGFTGETGTVHAARGAVAVPVTQLVVRNGIFDTQRRRAGRS